jgi:hypothetical protein
MNIELTVSFHGGSGGKNNLHVYPGGADVLEKGHPERDELRGFVLGLHADSDHLYVVNAHKSLSQILRYRSNGDGSYGHGEIWASDHLHHPFDAAWGSDGNLYVSNQDATSKGNIRITGYEGPGGESPGRYVSCFAEGFSALRGIAWAGDTLYVADEGGGADGTGGVNLYDRAGTPLGSFAVKKPVHVLYDGSRYVYIGSSDENAVYVYDATATVPHRPTQLLQSTKDVPIDAVSGLAIVPSDETTYLFVGDRKGRAINRYVLDTSADPPTASGGTVWLSNLPDRPEFLGMLGSGSLN